MGIHEASQAFNGLSEALRALQERCDVFEDDPFLREVRDISNKSFDQGLLRNRGKRSKRPAEGQPFVFGRPRRAL